jgi:ABC-type proline/glycine betaine transport system permease subunit
VVRPRFALVLLCGTVAVAAWCAAGLGGLEWSGIENAATSIWNGGAPRAATTPGGAESTSS